MGVRVILEIYRLMPGQTLCLPTLIFTICLTTSSLILYLFLPFGSVCKLMLEYVKLTARAPDLDGHVHIA